MEDTRSNHLEWCKQRATEYLDRGDVTNAVASIMSDLNKHPDTERHPGIRLGMMLMLGGQLSTVDQAREFIQGFN